MKAVLSLSHKSSRQTTYQAVPAHRMDPSIQKAARYAIHCPRTDGGKNSQKYAKTTGMLPPTLQSEE